MIPRLFEADSTVFTSGGMGSLPDVTTLEIQQDLNGEFELYMEYPVDGLHADDIAVERIIYTKPDDLSNSQPFRIYDVEEELDGYKYTIYAHHIGYDLSDYPVEPFSATGVLPALTGLVSHSMVSHSFTVWTDITNTETAFSLEEPRSFRACIGGVQGSILDRFGGELEWDGFTVKLHAHRGSDRGVYIRYAKNLESFKNERETENWTGVLAYWSQDDQTVMGDIQYITDHAQYARERIYLLNATEDFDDPPVPSDLNARATQYMTANDFGVPFSDTLKISFVPLWQTEEYKNIASLERVALGDTVHVIYRSYNVAMQVISVIYDGVLGKYKEITLGKKKATLSSTIKQIINDSSDGVVATAVSMMQGAIDHAADVMAGGTGGYIVIGRNADGQPNEIYIMDSPDMGTAVNVMRMNYAGIAFSQTGINGEYTTAWTIDSNFYADFITAGTLNGNLIQAGSILTSALEVAVQTIVEGAKLNFSFLNDGLHVSTKEGNTIVGAYQTILSDLGMRVIQTSTSQVTLRAEEDTVTAVNLTADQYLRVRSGNVASRFQTFYSTAHQEDEFGLFWEIV